MLSKRNKFPNCRTRSATNCSAHVSLYIWLNFKLHDKKKLYCLSSTKTEVLFIVIEKSNKNVCECVRLGRAARERGSKVNRVVCETLQRAGEVGKRFKGLVSLALVTNIRFYVCCFIYRNSPWMWKSATSSMGHCLAATFGAFVPTYKHMFRLGQANDLSQTLWLV